MSTVTVTKTFTLPEDADDLALALNATDYYLAWEDLNEWLRKCVKYEDRETLTFDELREKLNEIRNEYDL